MSFSTRDGLGATGVLRLFVLFHEAQSLGAGTSVLRAVEPLTEYGWTASGWFPGNGPLHDRAAERLASTVASERPLAFSRRGWSETPGVATRIARTPAYFRAVRAALSRVRPHVVHANTLLSLPEAAIARSCGLPVVMQVHELPDAGAKRTATIRLAARVADVLVGVSDAVTAMLLRHAGRTPVLTAYNGVPDVATKKRNASRPFTVGAIGTVSRVKGTDVFVRAAIAALAQRPGLRFEHLGSPSLHRDPGLDSEIAGLLSGSEHADSITMLGQRPAESALGDWDAFLLTSRTEAFPLATLEAMAAGLPVVATAVGGVPEQISHPTSGVLVPSEDSEAIASWVVRLHDDPELRRSIAAEGARRVRSEFTMSRQAESLHRAYLTALNLRFGPPQVRSRSRATR